MARVVVTTSWDDGHIKDLRVAELLRRYGLSATFYVSPKNHEIAQEQRLPDASILALQRDFEIGAHTMTHPRLTHVDPANAWLEITESKDYLEHLTGQPVTSFCYPGGARNNAHRKMVRDAGFTYVRGIKRFNIGRPSDPMDAQTTIHAYHHWSDLWRIARFARFNPFKIVKYMKWDNLAIALFDHVSKRGGVFHLWGHSWEIDQRGDWGKLERVFRHISKVEGAAYVANHELVGPTLPTVLMTTPYFHPSVGGLEVYALNLARQLKDGLKWRVVIATTTEPGQPEGVYEIEGLTVHRLRPTLKISKTSWSFNWTRQLREIIQVEQPTVINAHGPVPGMAEATAMAAGRIPMVLTWHAGSMRKGQPVSDFVTGIYEATILPWLTRRATSVVCTAQSTREYVMAKKPEALTIPPGVDADLFTPPSALAQDTILFVVGSLTASTQYKGLWRLLKVMPQVQKQRPNAKLVVVGDGSLRAAYEKYARQHSINVVFKGVLHGQALAEVYRASTVFALPTTNDSFSMVILEAMASGLPVVSFPTGSIPQLVEDGVTGSLVTSGGRKLSESLVRYLADDSLAQMQGAAGRARAATMHTWSMRATESVRAFELAARPQIVQVSSYYPPHLGGLENVMKELSAHLAENGWAVQVLTSNIGHKAGPPGGRLPDADKRSRPNGSPVVHALPAIEILHTPIMFGLFLRLMTCPKRSVIHLHIAQALTPEITMLAATLRRLPVVAHVHLDVDPSSRIGEVIFRPYKRIILRQVLRAADQVIALSSEQRDQMIRTYGLSPERVAVVPNGVSKSFFMPAREAPHFPLRLLYVGRLVVQKRPERLIETAARLGELVHLDIVGDGEDRAGLQSLAFRYGLHNVSFHGIKRDEELRAFYRMADAFILPSDKEGLPLVLLEALAGGLPIIGSDVTGIREHIKGVGVLVANPSPETFSTAINRLISSPGDYVQLSRQSIAAASAYSWDILATRFAALYQEVTT